MKLRRRYRCFLMIAVFIVMITAIIFLKIVNKDASNDTKKEEVISSNSQKSKGVAITLNDAINSDAWYDINFPKIKKLGADLEVVTPVYIADKSDSIPQNDPKIIEKLDRLIRKSKQYNIKINIIKPHIMTKESGDAFPKATYNPKDIQSFFKRWKEIMDFYSNFCKKNDIPIISISNETINITQNNYIAHWEFIIKEIKSINPNIKVTVSFSKNEFNRELNYYKQKRNSLSEVIDIISLNIYPMVKKSVVNKKIIVSDNNFLIPNDEYGYVESIEKANKYFRKEILITETGASARSDSSKDYLTSVNFDKNLPLDHKDQNDWIKVVLSTVLQMDQVRGVYIWHVDSPFNFLDSPTSNTIKSLYEKY